MRAARALLNLLTVLLVTTIVTLALALYLAFAQQNLPLLRALTGYIGRVMQGQQVQRLTLDVDLAPSARRLSVTATLEVRNIEEGRGRVYVLLNEGLRIEHVWLEAAQGQRVAARHYRLGPLVVFALPRLLTADETVRIGIQYAGDPSASGLTPSRGVLTAQEVILKAEHFWYPTDLQGFFDAEVTVTLPSALRVIHNGRELDQVALGRTARVRWSTPRPVSGLALVAGVYKEWFPAGDSRLRVALGDDVDLDAQQIYASVQEAERIFTELYGATGFEGVTTVVSRAVNRAFNDGTGLIVLSPRSFRDGDYGFGILAHETAHNWWGGTVAEKWLLPGTGGEWIVEGFAELSSWLAIEQHLGQSALLRRLDAIAFDPTRSQVLADMSALDNALNPAARATIYHKGPLAARLLQRTVGDELFQQAMRQLIVRFSQQQISDRDVEATFADVTKTDVSAFFDTWVRADAMMDLALDPHADGGAVARNHGPAWTPTTQQLLQVPQNGEPQLSTVELGATASMSAVGEMILDPGAAMPDVYRGNNVFPPRRSPRSVSVSARGELLVLYGDPHAWSPMTVSHLSATGQSLHEWDLDRGALTEPAWAADGIRAIYAESDRNGVTRLVSLNTADGSRTTVGHDAAAAPIANGLIVARGDRLLRLQGNDSVTLVHHPGRRLDAPLVSPSENEVAYTATGADVTDLRVVGADGSNDRLILSWQPTSLVWRWSPHGTHVFAVLPGDWDWQLWEIPAGRGTPRALAREAAAIHDVAVAADGQRVALTAVPTIDDANARAEVFIVDLQSGAARRLSIVEHSAEHLAWSAPDELLVSTVEREIRALPRRRQLQRLTVSDGSSRPFP